VEGWGWAAARGVEKRLESITCAVCRDIARRCSLFKCPFYRDIVKSTLSRLGRERTVFGPTPPTAIVGEWGYPRVYLGAGLVFSPDIESSALESPSSWLSLSIESLLEMRLGILLGRRRVSVMDARRPSRVLEAVQESSASVKPVDIELRLSEGGLRYVPGFNVRAAPYGPAAKVEGVQIVGNISIPRQVYRVLEDPYVTSREAVKYLFTRGFDEYYLTRLLSSGLLGRHSDRLLVPTEWSITAVDEMLARIALMQVKRYRLISEFRVHSFSALHNTAHVVLTPTPWMFELLEGWVRSGEVYSDSEFWWGRRGYAENTGGAYYACRLPILRHLQGIRAMSGAIVFFEVDRGWIPLGVWRFREVVRAALEAGPLKFSSLEEVIEYIEPRLRLKVEEYIRRSALIPALIGQSRLAQQ